MDQDRIRHIRRWLDILPPWLPTAATVIIILFLTLDPSPFGDHKPRLFEGADKVAHALMFGFLTLVMLLDHTRFHKWREASTASVITAAIISTSFGCLIEFIQLEMNMGRGFETADMLADLAGAVLAAAAWMILKNRIPQ